MESKLTINFTGENEIYLGHTITNDPSNSQHIVHIHDGYELYFFLQGDVTYNIEGQTYKLNSKDILIINNKELHRPYFDSNSTYERMVIHFNPDSISLFNCDKYNILQAFENRKLGHGNRINSTDVVKEGLEQCIKELESCFNTDSPERLISLKTMLIQLLIKINRLYLKKTSDNEEILRKSSLQDEKVHSILEYINANLNKKITLNFLQSNFYVNKYYLCHVFKKSTGFTIFEYITYKRIMKAKELLRKKIPINEVYVEVGFEDYSNFYKVFKRILGVSPREFLNS
jgi:AraC-like DNA-binding protein